jgi:uncharacterized membrane protein YkgB
MTTLMQNAAPEKSSLVSQVEVVGRELARYGLVVVVGWIGLLKFTAYEAVGIRLFVSNSPLMSWVYGPMSVRGFSAVLGVIEVAIAMLIAARPFFPRASALGSALAVGMFLTTLSFLVTTPFVWETTAGGFPALSGIPGQFLIKDLPLLGISLWTLGEAWKASGRRSRTPADIGRKVIRADPEDVRARGLAYRSGAMPPEGNSRVPAAAGVRRFREIVSVLANRP